jgi:hypothetical protein
MVVQVLRGHDGIRGERDRQPEEITAESWRPLRRQLDRELGDVAPGKAIVGGGVHGRLVMGGSSRPASHTATPPFVQSASPRRPWQTPPGASSRAAGQLTLIRSAVAASAAMRRPYLASRDGRFRLEAVVSRAAAGLAETAGCSWMRKPCDRPSAPGSAQLETGAHVGHDVGIRPRDRRRIAKPASQTRPIREPGAARIRTAGLPSAGAVRRSIPIREGLEDALATFGQIRLLSFHAGHEKAGVGSRGELVALVPRRSA